MQDDQLLETKLGSKYELVPKQWFQKSFIVRDVQNYDKAITISTRLACLLQRIGKGSENLTCGVSKVSVDNTAFLQCFGIESYYGKR